MRNSIINSVKDYLKDKYNCHSMILYGSFADNTYTDESDIDVICFSDDIDNQNDTNEICGRLLDAWIYNTDKIKDYKDIYHINDGIIILDERNLCCDLLDNINKFITEEKKPTLAEITFQKNWLQKMINRAKRGDAEGNFRYHWMLIDSLEIYFSIKGFKYLGPKKSLNLLKSNDENAYRFFSEALEINSSFKKVEELVSFIVNL